MSRKSDRGGSGPVRKPPQRQPGRPSGEGDRRALALDAALACYVRRGIAATSLRDIAREAGITPALLHYYFGDAAGLREAVVGERLMPVFTGIRDTLLGMPDAPLREVIVAFVDGICGMIRRHPWLPPLWIREVVSEGGDLRELLVTRLAPQIATVLAARFAAEQAAGRLNPGLDPRLLMVSLVGLTLFPAAGTPIWREIFASDDLGIDDIRDHALALIERGLELPA
ncbi:TetR/AcrR family transcriptional regulator [Luteimonas viscosa]|uniref:TetR/AcrR family transcriptional regulator n=1 Tax=Luteimonas viscosa TaxID=1132694 RepID=A0A5D4XWF3_9GAMM|nr:TetR/AcrR family transcriptional regulator [Luteimonas viscosa]TYT27200.1 TetR/AcrR family transcriptional regulator [Luteimonas viscosa]